MQNYLLEKRLDSEVSEIIFNMGNLLKLLDNQIIQNEPLDDEVFVSRFDYINRIKYLLMLSKSIVKVDTFIKVHNKIILSSFKNVMDKMGYHHVRIQYHLSRIK